MSNQNWPINIAFQANHVQSIMVPQKALAEGGEQGTNASRSGAFVAGANLTALLTAPRSANNELLEIMFLYGRFDPRDPGTREIDDFN